MAYGALLNRIAATFGGLATPAPSFSTLPHPPPPPASLPPTASFSSLPAELKSSIASYVQALDQERPAGEAYSWVAPTPEQVVATIREWSAKEGDRTQEEMAEMMARVMEISMQSRSGLAAYGLVSRQCYLAARPLMWKHVNLGGRTTRSLLTFVRDILPRHHPLVTSLKWRVWNTVCREDLGAYDSDEVLSPDDKDLVHQVERVAADLLVGEEPFKTVQPRRLRMPGLLVALVVKQCANLDTVDVHEYEKLINAEYSAARVADKDDEFEDEDDVDERLEDVALNTLRRKAGSLKSLTFVVGQMGSPYGLLNLVNKSPNLKKLTVSHNPPDEDDEDEDYLYEALDEYALYKAFAKLKFLTEWDLGLPLADYLGDLLGEGSKPLHFHAPLEKLHLREPGPDSATTLHRFLNCFSSTLTNLRIDYADPPKTTPLVAFDLPNLTHLAISSPDDSGNSDASIYPFFSRSPIHTFRLVDCAQTCLPHILAFLTAHRTTLKRVEFLQLKDYGGKITAAELRSLEKACSELGLSYSAVEIDGPCWVLGGRGEEDEEEEEEAEEDEEDE